jgi:conjugal transfer pilus assembly protein TraA
MKTLQIPALAVKQASQRKNIGLLAAALCLGAVATASPVLAGADTTFNTALATFTGFVQGSGGKIVAVIAMIGGLAAMASNRFSTSQVLIPIGVGIAAGVGVPIVTSTVTALI